MDEEDKPELKYDIPELQYDIIARIIPGTAIVAIYALKFDHHALEGFSGISLSVVFGYIVGYMLEILSLRIIDLSILSPFISKFNFSGEKYPNAEQIEKAKGHLITEGSLWKHRHSSLELNKTEVECREPKIFVKMLAERTLYRGLLFGSFLALIWPPEIIKNHQGNGRPVILLFLVPLCYCLYRTSRSISDRVKRDIKKALHKS